MPTKRKGSQNYGVSIFPPERGHENDFIAMWQVIDDNPEINLYGHGETEGLACAYLVTQMKQLRRRISLAIKNMERKRAD